MRGTPRFGVAVVGVNSPRQAPGAARWRWVRHAVPGPGLVATAEQARRLRWPATRSPHAHSSTVLAQVATTFGCAPMAGSVDRHDARGAEDSRGVLRALYARKGPLCFPYRGSPALLLSLSRPGRGPPRRLTMRSGGRCDDHPRGTPPARGWRAWCSETQSNRERPMGRRCVWTWWGRSHATSSGHRLHSGQRGRTVAGEACPPLGLRSKTTHASSLRSWRPASSTMTPEHAETPGQTPPPKPARVLPCRHVPFPFTS